MQGDLSLIYSAYYTTEWNLMKLSQDLYYMFILWTSFFRFWSKLFWGFYIAKHGLFMNMGMSNMVGGHLLPVTLHMSLNGIEWNFKRICILCSHCAQYIFYIDWNQYGVSYRRTWTCHLWTWGHGGTHLLSVTPHIPWMEFTITFRESLLHVHVPIVHLLF